VESLWPPIIAAGGVVVGVLITGTFAVVTQWLNQKTEDKRWAREAEERRRTRFHEARLTAYTELYHVMGSASGQALQMAIKYHGDRPDGPSAASLPDFRKLDLAKPDVNEAALQTMGAHEAQVLLLAESQELRTATRVAVQKIFELTLNPGDHPDWRLETNRTWEACNAARERFLELAHAGLTR
jgi:hypothetical protein